MRVRALSSTLLAMLLLATGPSWSSAQEDDFMEVPGFGRTRIDVPRPSSGGSPCALDLPVGTTVERVRGLRAAGLFPDKAPLTDEALAAQIEAAIATSQGALEPDDPLAELLVAGQDPVRVWWQDLEADVWSGGGSYRRVLEEWATISMGTFAPTSVTEAWASETGPVSVRFEMDGTSHVLAPEYLEDWIDPRILEPIDELIAPSGRQFRMVAPFDQTAFVMALTDPEQTALEARGWCFT